MWHHASYRGDELIVLGHDPRRNDCMLVKLSGLPMNEQQDLRRIAASRSAQEATYLIPLLRRVESPSGSDWFTYLAKKMEQRNSPVFTLPLKEIQDSLDPDQKAIFKGYGKGRRNSSLDMHDLERAQSGGLDTDDDDLPMMSQARSEPVHQRSSDIDNKLDVVLETIAEESRQTRQVMMKLLQALAPEPAKKQAPRPRKTAPRPTVKKTKTQVEAQAYEA